MLELGHHDDGKGRWQSHEISLIEDEFYNGDIDVYSHNPFDIYGYGETKEEALRDFMKKFKYIMDEWTSFEMMLFESDFITDNIVEVDCFGKKI